MKKDCIIISVPKRFWVEYPGGREAFDKIMDYVDAGKTFWYQTISNIPIQEVQFVYLIIEGQVALRLTVYQMLKNQNMVFKDGGEVREFSNKNWVVLTGPVQKADKSYPMKGFQGFRYTELLF